MGHLSRHLYVIKNSLALGGPNHQRSKKLSDACNIGHAETASGLSDHVWCSASPFPPSSTFPMSKVCVWSSQSPAHMCDHTNLCTGDLRHGDLDSLGLARIHLLYIANHENCFATYLFVQQLWGIILCTAACQ